MRIYRIERVECKFCDRKFVLGDGLRKYVRKKYFWLYLICLEKIFKFNLINVLWRIVGIKKWECIIIYELFSIRLLLVIFNIVLF